MFPRKPLSFRQQFAQASGLGKAAFAPTRALSQDAGMACETCSSVLAHLDCYPFPSPWPGPLRVRPFFAARRQSDADAVNDGIFQCSFPADSLDSVAIKTSDRGSQTCVNPSFSLPFSPCRLPAACKTRLRAGLPGPLRAPSSPMRPTTTPSPARSSADLRAQRPARFLPRNAVRPATTDLTAASAASETIHQGPIGVCPRLVLFHFADRRRPDRHEGRAPCSRKS